MSRKEVKIEESWKQQLKEEFSKEYFSEMSLFLKNEKANQKIVYPKGKDIFNAFNLTPFQKVKVVILGQDPYHGPDQAMGLSFSVSKGIKPPPSLRNIYKELKLDLGLDIPDHGDLSSWAKQGVFLLNSVLTVEQRNPGSHKAIGWQNFTDSVIKKLSKEREGLVFLLWGNFAKSKKILIDEMKHFVLESVHPSPFTGNAFFGNNHFSKTNDLLINQGKTPIDWKIE
jgi:uracil-DNA glycosylase